MIPYVNIMKKNELIPIGLVMDKTSKEMFNVKITGTYQPVIIDDTMINLLKFNKKYYKPIITGLKTQTLRKSNKKITEDEIIKAVFPGTKNECTLKITKTGYKQFKYLNDEDAKMEGYDSLEDLKKDLLTIYSNLDNFDRLYYYQFQVVDENDI